MKFLRRLIPYALVILALVLVFPVLCGCSGADTSNRFHELLKLIPSELKDSPALLLLTDIASFHEDNNISLYDSEGQPITFEEYIEILIQKQLLSSSPRGSDIIGYGQYAIAGTIKDKYIGYNFTSSDAEIQTGLSPHNVVAAIGRYDPQATRDALSHQDEWPAWVKDIYTTEEYRGVTVHSWGDGFKIHLTDVLVPPHIDALGRARPLAVTDEFLFYGPTLEGVKSMIDASQGKAESLADLPEFAEIADALSGPNVYSVTLVIESMVNGDPDFEGTYPGPRLKRFVTVGSASGKDDSGTYSVLVLYHESPDDAQANVSLLEQRIADTNSAFDNTPWREIITATDIHVEGNLLVAKLYNDYPGLFMVIVYARDILLLHEE